MNREITLYLQAPSRRDLIIRINHVRIFPARGARQPVSWSRAEGSVVKEVAVSILNHGFPSGVKRAVIRRAKFHPDNKRRWRGDPVAVRKKVRFFFFFFIKTFGVSL